MEKICFICTGNTCRSPVAEKILKKYLKEANINIKVSSYGIKVNKGDNISQNSIVALKKLGITVKKHLAKQLTKSVIKSGALFITMTTAHKRFLPESVIVFSFGEIVNGKDIVDPFGQSQEKYDEMANQINEYSKILVEKLKHIKGDYL